jgi:hypothetical protein
VQSGCKEWLKFKNPDAPAVKREAEEEWGRLLSGDGIDVRRNRVEQVRGEPMPLTTTSDRGASQQETRYRALLHAERNEGAHPLWCY